MRQVHNYIFLIKKYAATQTFLLFNQQVKSKLNLLFKGSKTNGFKIRD